MKYIAPQSITFFILITTGLYVVSGSKVKILTHPKSQEVDYGQDVALQCVFNHDVSCIWIKNENKVAIGGRYSMPNKKADQPTNNCLLKIKSFTDSDIGHWKCSTLASSDTANAINSKAAKLSMRIVQCQPQKKQNTNVNVKKDKKVNLLCKFNKNVRCIWKKNEEVIKIAGRYKFKSKVPTSTKDCSITIRSAQKSDEGEWKCSSMADDNYDSINCEAIKLTIK